MLVLRVSHTWQGSSRTPWCLFDWGPLVCERVVSPAPWASSCWWGAVSSDLWTCLRGPHTPHPVHWGKFLGYGPPCNCGLTPFVSSGVFQVTLFPRTQEPWVSSGLWWGETRWAWSPRGLCFGLARLSSAHLFNGDIALQRVTRVPRIESHFPRVGDFKANIRALSTKITSVAHQVISQQGSAHGSVYWPTDAHTLSMPVFVCKYSLRITPCN